VEPLLPLQLLMKAPLLPPLLEEVVLLRPQLVRRVPQRPLPQGKEQLWPPLPPATQPPPPLPMRI